MPLPLTELQARVSHLQDAKAKGREKGKRWHGAGTGLGAEVEGPECKGEDSMPGNHPGARAMVTSSQATSNTDL